MTLSQNILSLSKIEQSKFFEMLTNNIDLLIKVMPDIPLLTLIKMQNFDAYQQDELIQAYLAWRNKR
jgi:hypothetical protein